MVSILCFYHSPCNDGSASAAALRYRLQHADHLGGDYDIRFCPLGFNTEWDEPLPETYLENEVLAKHTVREIYFVDISVSPTKFHQIEDYLERHGRLRGGRPHVVCIDHHETARRNVDELGTFCDETYIRIGPGLSGATLVWQYFNERFGESLETPELLRYVADQDIWEWKLPDSREINAALNTLDGHVDDMDQELYRYLKSPEVWRRERTAEGVGIIRMVDAQVRKSLQHTIDISVGETTLRIVNASSFSSETGNYLCNHSDAAPHVLAVIYSIQEDWSVRCSVRTIDGAKINAREFAERYGGGGHNNASGCRFSTFDAFRREIDRLASEGW